MLEYIMAHGLAATRVDEQNFEVRTLDNDKVIAFISRNDMHHDDLWIAFHPDQSLNKLLAWNDDFDQVMKLVSLHLQGYDERLIEVADEWLNQTWIASSDGDAKMSWSHNQMAEAAVHLLTRGDQDLALALQNAFADSHESMAHYIKRWTRFELIENFSG